MDNKRIFYKKRTDIRDMDGKRTSLDGLYRLQLEGIEIQVIRGSDNRDVTKEILRAIEKKVWSDGEITTLKRIYGKENLNDIHRNHLPGKSVGQIRWKASQLSLTMDMKWQEHEVQALTALRKSGVSFPIIAKILQRPIAGIQQKAHKIGLVYGGRSEENQEEMLQYADALRDLPSLSKGKIAEDLVSIKLTEKSFDVWLPYTPSHRTDLMVMKGNRVAKLQVKSGIWDRGTGRFRVPLRRKHVIKQTRFHYDPSDVDFFILVCFGIDAIYVVPYELCKENSQAQLYPHRPKMVQKGFNWEIYRESYNLLTDFLDKQ